MFQWGRISIQYAQPLYTSVFANPISFTNEPLSGSISGTTSPHSGVGVPIIKSMTVDKTNCSGDNSSDRGSDTAWLYIVGY